MEDDDDDDGAGRACGRLWTTRSRALGIGFGPAAEGVRSGATARQTVGRAGESERRCFSDA